MNGKAKGNAFERSVCKQLSLWWSGGKDDSLFWRTHSSGGRATRRAKKGQTLKGQYGDVCATSAEGQPLLDLCVIEIKRGYGRWSDLDLLDKSSKSAPQQLEKWIAKAEEDRKASGVRNWLIIAKRDKRETVIMFLRPRPELSKSSLCPYLDGVHVILFNRRLIISRLDWFLEKVSPEHVKQEADKQENTRTCLSSSG